MEIDLNDPQSFTRENVRKLIASKDDSQNRQLRVSQRGIAFISDEWTDIDPKGMALRYETLCMGNGYLGEKAAADDDWVARVEHALRRDWAESQKYPGSACVFVEF